MKTLGLIGGMSWESTQVYYQHINRGVKNRLGGLHSAPLILHSVNFAEIAELQHENNWAALAEVLTNIGVNLEKAGAEGLLICTNTMHKVADNIAKMVQIPVLHIGDAIINACNQNQYSRVGLLGTQFTMEQPFLRRHLEQAGLEVIVPDEQGRALVHDVIYQELCQGIIKSQSKEAYQRVIDQLRDNGAQAVILGCTEISLLVAPEDSSIPVLDTTMLHAQMAVDFITG